MTAMSLLADMVESESSSLDLTVVLSVQESFLTIFTTREGKVSVIYTPLYVAVLVSALTTISMLFSLDFPFSSFQGFCLHLGHHFLL
jgi:hypothetical protein